MKNLEVKKLLRAALFSKGKRLQYSKNATFHNMELSTLQKEIKEIEVLYYSVSQMAPNK